MHLAFILTMPGNNSWDGKWTGDGKLYCVLRDVSDERAAELVAKRNYGYNFGDGWFANIQVRSADLGEMARLMEESQGFYGYEWMIDPIIDYGKIMRDDQIEEFLKARKEPTVTP